MLLLLHIIIALSSVAYATYAYMRPSTTALHNTYILIAGTLGSGTILVITAPAHMIQACVSGIVYLVLVGAVTIATRSKLARLRNTM